MASFNKVYLMGNITRDIELRYTPGGAAVCDMGLAVNRRWSANGQDQEETTFVDVTVWNKQAENCSRFLKKGSPCFIEGRLRLDTWDDRESGQKRSRLRVVAENVQFLGARGDQVFDQQQDYGQQPMPQSFGQPQQPMAAPYQPPQPPAGGYGGQPAPMPQQNQPTPVQQAPAPQPQVPPAMPQMHQAQPQMHQQMHQAQPQMHQPQAAPMMPPPQQQVQPPQPPPMPEHAFNVQDVEDDIPF